MSIKMKISELPDFKHAPCAPAPTKITVEGTVKSMLDLLLRHDAADQNKIVTQILGRSLKDRYYEYEAARKAEQIAGANFEKLMATAKDIDGILKEIAESKAKGDA